MLPQISCRKAQASSSQGLFTPVLPMPPPLLHHRCAAQYSRRPSPSINLIASKRHIITGSSSPTTELENHLSTARHAPTSTSIANAAHASPRSSRQLSTVQTAKRRLFKIYQTSAHQPPNASAPHPALIQTCQNRGSANNHTRPLLFLKLLHPH